MFYVNFGFRIDHIAMDRDTFVEYRKFPWETRCNYIGNNSHVEVESIGTCELRLCIGRVLLPRDVLYAAQIHQNVILVLDYLLMNFSHNSRL